jgi:hypothetical protein
MSTAWHPQTDGASERKNQTTEIGLRYQIFLHPDQPWSGFVIAFQAALNNAWTTAIQTSPNEFVTGSKPATDLMLLVGETKGDPPEVIRKLRQRDAEVATDFANDAAKQYYDAKHQPLTMDVGDRAFLKLHRGYKLPGNPNRKLSEQRTGPFEIIRRVGKLAYELKLPPQWKIHPVISVAHLEPAPKGQDPFGREPIEGKEPVDAVEGDDDEWQSWELERIVDKRYTKYGGKDNLEYLVKYLGWGNQYNEWQPVELLAQATELIQDFEERLKGAPTTTRRRGRPRKDV